ncbi:hypothetical protein HDV02_002622 [Globomyces sp. JEL0801]|nr:hypothetical protein HDV02_002622 [Globomyces sp. JEL0801]
MPIGKPQLSNQMMFQLKDESYLDVRPWEHTDYSEEERVKTIKFAKMAFRNMKLPKEDIHWDYLKNPNASSQENQTPPDLTSTPTPTEPSFNNDDKPKNRSSISPEKEKSLSPERKRLKLQQSSSLPQIKLPIPKTNNETAKTIVSPTNKQHFKIKLSNPYTANNNNNNNNSKPTTEKKPSPELRTTNVKHSEKESKDSLPRKRERSDSSLPVISLSSMAANSSDSGSSTKRVVKEPSKDRLKTDRKLNGKSNSTGDVRERVSSGNDSTSRRVISPMPQTYSSNSLSDFLNGKGPIKKSTDDSRKLTNSQSINRKIENTKLTAKTNSPVPRTTKLTKEHTSDEDIERSKTSLVSKSKKNHVSDEVSEQSKPTATSNKRERQASSNSSQLTNGKRTTNEINTTTGNPSSASSTVVDSPMSKKLKTKQPEPAEGNPTHEVIRSPLGKKFQCSDHLLGESDWITMPPEELSKYASWLCFRKSFLIEQLYKYDKISEEFNRLTELRLSEQELMDKIRKTLIVHGQLTGMSGYLTSVTDTVANYKVIVKELKALKSWVLAHDGTWKLGPGTKD